jgi:hypothetical protein
LYKTKGEMMTLNEIIKDMDETLDYAVTDGFSDYIDRHVVRQWIDNLKSVQNTLAQQSLSGSDDKSSSAQICNGFEEGSRCTKGYPFRCGQCGYLSEADF